MKEEIKKIDNYGRVNIPKKYRKKIQVICGEYIKMKIEGKKIIIEKLDRGKND